MSQKIPYLEAEVKKLEEDSQHNLTPEQHCRVLHADVFRGFQFYASEKTF